jgi:hypothetical protein
MEMICGKARVEQVRDERSSAQLYLTFADSACVEGRAPVSDVPLLASSGELLERRRDRQVDYPSL